MSKKKNNIFFKPHAIKAEPSTAFKRGLFFLFIICSGTNIFSQSLVTYPVPQAVVYSMHNDDYTVRVKEPGKQWQDLYEYNVKVDMDKPQDASMVYFDFSGQVEVCVRKNNGAFNKVNIRPASAGIVPLVKDGLVYLKISKPCKISIEFDGDRLHNLHLFANEIEKNRPDSSGSNVIYFGPGLHKPDSLSKGQFFIPSGKTVYIHGSAILRGKLVCENVKDVKIIGRGIIDQPQEGCLIAYSNNVLLEGINFINPVHYTVLGGQSTNITIRNIKSFSSRGWSDGIDMMSCSNVMIDDVFMRNSDDCIAIYGHRWNYRGSGRNYLITNSTLWADIAHPINIGTHGNTTYVGDTLENIVFRNIDILEHDEDDPEYEGCMALSVGDHNLVRNITFENIRVADFQEGKLLSLRLFFNKKYNTGPGRGIENIYFKNIHYTGANLAQSVIKGYDAAHAVKGIVFENLVINGKKITKATDADISIGSFVSDVRFK